ncbi:MAG TPA: hypothetical protein VMW38_05270 [Terriglobia bacterium]|nr:hypothetical protein [Terriglobia bacterium]
MPFIGMVSGNPTVSLINNIISRLGNVGRGIIPLDQIAIAATKESPPWKSLIRPGA